jgi:hypothetical protein
MPSRFQTLIVAVSLALACLGSARPVAAQAPPTSGPEHKLLEQTVGTWDAEMRVNGVDTPSKCVAKYTSTCGGLWVASEFEGDLLGQKFQGRGLDGYDTAKKKYVSVWVDSMITAPMFFEGEYDAARKKMTQVATAPGMDGQPAKWKSVTTMDSADKHTFEMFVTPQGGDEARMFTITYTRRK